MRSVEETEAKRPSTLTSTGTEAPKKADYTQRKVGTITLKVPAFLELVSDGRGGNLLTYLPEKTASEEPKDVTDLMLLQKIHVLTYTITSIAHIQQHC